eukprot:4110425-Pyramimonas_sp.AAC.1
MFNRSRTRKRKNRLVLGETSKLKNTGWPWETYGQRETIPASVPMGKVRPAEFQPAGKPC